MEIWIFYWLAWLLWIIVYFFNLHTNTRFYYSCFVLLLITLSNTHISFQGIILFVPLMINLILGLIVLSKSSQKFISISIAICLSFAYGGLQIWENFNPLWLFVSSSFLSVFISIILFYIFIKQPLNRIGIALISTSMGQMLYSFVGISYGFLESIGDLKYLTDVVLIVMTLMVWFKMKRFSEIIEQGIKNGAFRMKT